MPRVNDVNNATAACPALSLVNGHLLKFVTILVCSCLWQAGCKKAPTWSSESRSLDQKMIAKAETVDNGGFGTGFTQTAVFLNWTTGSQKPKLILSFSDGPNVPGGMNVELKWLSNDHLEIAYRGARPIDFEAVRCDGIDISVRDLDVRTENRPQ